MAERPRLTAIALPLALTFACTTVRAPASGIAPTTAVHGGVAEPQVELWVESSRAVGPETLAQASDDARRALRDALADRQAPGGGDAILVVRAQAVSRTAERRGEQKAAVAGIVIGAVVVVAVVVLMVASGKGGGGGPRATPSRAPRAAPIHAPRVGRAAVPVAVAAHPRVVRVAAGRPVSGSVAVVSVGPFEPEPAVLEAVVQPPEAPPPEALIQPGVVTLTLAPPPPLELASRGYFAGDLLRLELLLVDAQDGAVRSQKTVAAEVDVRDGQAVRALLAAALDDPAGWAPFAGAVTP